MGVFRCDRLQPGALVANNHHRTPFWYLGGPPAAHPCGVSVTARRDSPPWQIIHTIHQPVMDK